MKNSLESAIRYLEKQKYSSRCYYSKFVIGSHLQGYASAVKPDREQLINFITEFLNDAKIPDTPRTDFIAIEKFVAYKLSHIQSSPEPKKKEL